MHVRQVNTSFPTYNLQAIEAWHAEVLKNPLDIQQHQLDIKMHGEQLNIFTQQLQSLVTQHIVPCNLRIESIEAQINVLTIPAQIHRFNADMQPHTDRLAVLYPQLDAVSHIIAPIDADIELLSNFIDVRESQRKIAGLSQTIVHAQQSIKSHEDELHELEHELKNIDNGLSNERSRLASLQTQQSIDSAAHMSQLYSDHYSHHHHHHQHGGFNSFAHNAGDMAVSVNIATTQASLNDLERKHHKLDGRMRELQLKLASHQQEKASAVSESQQLQRRLDDLMHRVGNHSFTDNVVVLRANLAQKRNDKTPHELARRAFDEEIKKHRYDIEQLRKNISNSQKLYDRSVCVVREFGANQNLDDLNAQLQGARSLLRSQEQDKTRLDNLILSHRQGIATANQMIENKTRRQAELLTNQFMLQLRDSPNLLIGSLESQVDAAFQAYEVSNPAHQSEIIRIGLVDTRRKLDVIANMAVSTAEASRQKYYQLCGVLWEMLVNIKTDGNADMAYRLEQILQAHPIAQHDAQEAYRCLRKASPELLRDMTSDDLVAMQYSEYEAAQKNLNTVLTNITDDSSVAWCEFRECGYKVLSAINERKIHAVEIGDPTFDLKFHTTVLNKTAQLVQTPSNPALQSEYHRLTQHNHDGKPSLAKKIGGAALMFFGAALAVASVAAKLLSFGLAAPITFAGMAAGGAMCIAGFTLFGCGVQKGSSRKMASFEKAAVRAGVAPRLSTAKPVDKSTLLSNEIDGEATALKMSPA